MNIDEKISLSDYDANWEAQFEAEKKLLQAAFPDVHIAHIGSTSVPGMTAKPIIDILLGVQAFPPPEDMVTGLEELGYYHFGAHNTTHAQYYFVKRGAVNYNVHIDEYEGRRWNDLLKFRNYMRSHPEAAREYSQIKQGIIAKGKDTMLDYSYEKMEFIKAVTERMNAGD